MLKNSIAAFAVCLAIVSCAAPAGVPRGANVSYDPTAGPSGLEYSWQRRVEHGCVDFTAADLRLPELSLVTRLSIDPRRCGGGNRALEVCDSCGPGLWYAGDSLFIQNFWPRTREDSSRGPIFDSNGMWVANRPCPHTLSAEQVAAMRLVAQEALAKATTDPERRKLERIDQILAATNGAALEIGQHGCVPVIERASSPAAVSQR